MEFEILFGGPKKGEDLWKFLKEHLKYHQKIGVLES